MAKLDNGSLGVMGITAVLFVIALFMKGVTHDLLLETGVFLVSVKLMIMAYKNRQNHEQTHRMLSEIRDRLPAPE